MVIIIRENSRTVGYETSVIYVNKYKELIAERCDGKKLKLKRFKNLYDAFDVLSDIDRAYYAGKRKYVLL